MVFDRWHTKDIQTPTQHVFLLFSFIISSKGFIILSLFLSLCYYVSIIVSITGYFQLLCNIIAMTTQLFPGTAWNSLFPSNITVWALSWSIQHPSSFFLCVCRRCCSISFVLGKIQQNSTPDSDKWFQLTDQTRLCLPSSWAKFDYYPQNLGTVWMVVLTSSDKVLVGTTQRNI